MDAQRLTPRPHRCTARGFVGDDQGGGQSAELAVDALRTALRDG
ncbi:hypothetical protein [Streptomyces sp. NPDC056663]